MDCRGKGVKSKLNLGNKAVTVCSGRSTLLQTETCRLVFSPLIFTVFQRELLILVDTSFCHFSTFSTVGDIMYKKAAILNFSRGCNIVDIRIYKEKINFQV